MRRFLRIVGVLIVTAALAWFVAPPVDAHTPNPYANWACGASRPSSTHIITHAVPTGIAPGMVEAYCESRWLDGSHRTVWYALLWPNGEVSHWPYAYCYQGDYCEPEPG